jgi:hypothetical protein
VSYAATANQEKKPIWLIVGAFSDSKESTWITPTPRQLRACVYAGLIHGATGIIYFTWDTYVSRDGGVIGISPDPQVAYAPNPKQPNTTEPTPATPMQRVASKAAWATASQVNQEIAALVPSLLAPTVSPQALDYSILVDGLGRIENPIHCLLKPYPAGGYVLLTVNLNDSLLSATYTFPQELKSVERLFEDQPALTLAAGAKSFTDSYGSFGVHVYHITFN